MSIRPLLISLMIGFTLVIFSANADHHKLNQTQKNKPTPCKQGQYNDDLCKPGKALKKMKVVPKCPPGQVRDSSGKCVKRMNVKLKPKSGALPELPGFEKNCLKNPVPGCKCPKADKETMKRCRKVMQKANQRPKD